MLKPNPNLNLVLWKQFKTDFMLSGFFRLLYSIFFTFSAFLFVYTFDLYEIDNFELTEAL
jgi:hypothetical protein